MEVRIIGATAFGTIASLLFATACTVGPDYKRPIVDTPERYRSASDSSTGAASLADREWWELFQDPQLQMLIRTGLDRNLDVRVAAARILQAQAELGIVRADQFPTVAAGAAAARQRVAQSLDLPAAAYSTLELSVSTSWEIDFWGKFRRATESARALLLASEWGRRAIVTSLISQLASAYFDLRELDLELDIAKRTLATRQESLQLTQTRESRGATSLVDVRQAEQLVFTAAATIADLERGIEQQENLLSVLVGDRPGPITRGQLLVDQPLTVDVDVPAGLPSALLERRPDIRQAEQELVAANADIGVAKAAYFPQINLTGAGGFQSAALASLFSGPAGLFFAGAALTQPLFTGGKLKSNVALAEARREEALLSYQQTIQQSLRDVSDSLVAYRKAREFREQQEFLTRSAQDAQRLADVRYQGGATSYLEVLDSGTRLFAAELGLAQARLNELLTVVRTYRALGGGWDQ
ncbi:MAG TPA: efflux transporter outer membrane subunit [Vicinamibacterales bacterium]|nr:efflux transporter outer membrane subunit [Vicinamibacterales bacterium]